MNVPESAVYTDQNTVSETQNIYSMWTRPWRQPNGPDSPCTICWRMKCPDLRGPGRTGSTVVILLVGSPDKLEALAVDEQGSALVVSRTGMLLLVACLAVGPGVLVMGHAAYGFVVSSVGRAKTLSSLSSDDTSSKAAELEGLGSRIDGFFAAGSTSDLPWWLRFTGEGECVDISPSCESEEMGQLEPKPLEALDEQDINVSPPNSKPRLPSGLLTGLTVERLIDGAKLLAISQASPLPLDSLIVTPEGHGSSASIVSTTTATLSSTQALKWRY